MTKDVRIRREVVSDTIKFRLRSEIDKLESHLARLEDNQSSHRGAIMETYRTMIDTRADLLKQVEGRL